MIRALLAAEANAATGHGEAAAAQAATTGLATSAATFSTGCVDGYHENSVGNWTCEVDGRIPTAAGSNASTGIRFTAAIARACQL